MFSSDKLSVVLHTNCALRVRVLIVVATLLHVTPGFKPFTVKQCFIIQKIHSSAEFILQQLKQRTFLTGCKRAVIFFEWVELMMNLSEGTNQIMYGCPRFWHNNQYFPGLLIFLVIISSLLSFTTTLANISILFALPEVTSVHPPSKPLLRSLTMTDFGSGLIAQPLAITMILSSLKGTGISVICYNSRPLLHLQFSPV